jgi:hypothetical protein
MGGRTMAGAKDARDSLGALAESSSSLVATGEALV